MSVIEATTASNVTAEIAEQIADLYNAAGVCSTSSWTSGPMDVPCTYEDGRPMMSGNRPMMRSKLLHEKDEAVMTLVAGLTDDWRERVDTVLWSRYDAKLSAAAAKRTAEKIAAYEAIENAAIRAYLLEDPNRPGQTAPKPTDLSFLKGLAMAERQHKAAYKPSASCGAKLHLKQALNISYRQEAYADNSDFVVPVTLEEGCDIAVCKRNLWDFANACRTTNGLAGYGSSWSMELVVRPEGAFVLVDQRSSIAD